MHHPARNPVRSSVGLFCIACALSQVVRADTLPVVLHEYIAPNPIEDVALSATTLDGQLPAAMVTRDGAVEAPNVTRKPSPHDKAYGSDGSSSSKPRTDKYSPDRDTRKATNNRYDDPFTPATDPYKRYRAYDWVSSDFSLTVADASLSPVQENGVVSGVDDGFFGDITVDIVSGQPVRIPAVAPSTRIVRRSSQPRVDVDLFVDSAENWFVVGTTSTRTRLLMQLAVPREVFGGAFRDSVLGSKRRIGPVPQNVAQSVKEVLRFLELENERSTRAAVTQLVTYFRSFEPSNDAPHGRANVYLDLALSRKGVCRHRAYAFVVTALGMGIPSRMVHNEAHAWVEVHDGAWWRRIDLGGASERLDQGIDEQPRVRHRDAPDPFPWPEESKRDDPSNGGGAGSSFTAGSSGLSRGATTPPGVQRQISAYSYQESSPTETSSSVTKVPATLRVLSADASVLRGSPMRIEGAVDGGSSQCGFVQVNVIFREQRTSRTYDVGVVSTDDSGRFSGSVIVPLQIPVGEYEVVVATLGDSKCGPGTSSP